MPYTSAQKVADFRESLLRYLPELLGFRNRMRVHYLSYKVARLLLPWAVLAVLLVSFGLPRPWREAALAAQALFYGGTCRIRQTRLLTRAARKGRVTAKHLPSHDRKGVAGVPNFASPSTVWR